jgi:protein-tyrosine sulfotransferase
MSARKVETLSPIFIGGQRRSGTSLFRVLLNRHPHIACGPEAKVLPDPRLATWHARLTDEWAERIERYGFERDVIDRCMAALIDQLFNCYQSQEGKRRWAEKTPTNILRIDYLFRLFPRAQFIHVIRDPRDTYCSIRDRMQHDKPEWSKFHPSRAARDWRDAILAGQPWRDYPERYLEIHYEELVRNPERCLRQVVTFLNEPWDPHLLDPEADNVEARGDRQVHRGPITAGSIGRWQSELDRGDLKKIERVAGSLMAGLGYEPSLIR